LEKLKNSSCPSLLHKGTMKSNQSASC